MLAAVSLIAANSHAAAPATARIGALFPMWLSEDEGYVADSWGVGCFSAFRLALSEINNKTDGIADGLLPDTQLQYALRDSKCDDKWGILGAVQLTQNTFDQQGVHAIVGAACSSASLSAAFLGARNKVPQISYSSTSGELSDGAQYPFFARTVPSDAYQAFALANLIRFQFGYTMVATVATTDSYGQAGINAFHAAADQVGILVLTKELLSADERHFTSQYANLKASHARVIVLFCLHPVQTGEFLVGAHELGLGGPGYMWIGSDAITDRVSWESNEKMLHNETLRMQVMKGYFGVLPFVDDSTEAYASFAARMRAQPATNGNGSACNMEVDDDGGTLVWAQDPTTNEDPATPLYICKATSSSSE